MALPVWLRRQLSGPRGWLARPMAHLLNRGNGPDYQRALSKLGAGPGDHVLELGFGGGVGLRGLLASGANAMGVEPSYEMRERAYRKFSRPLAKGRLRIVDGCAEALPDGPFSHALSLNTVYFWTDVERGMSELRRTVRGTVLLGVAPAAHLMEVGFDQSGFRVEEPEFYAEALEQVGFSVEIEPPRIRASCALVIGTL